MVVGGMCHVQEIEDMLECLRFYLPTEETYKANENALLLFLYHQQVASRKYHKHNVWSSEVDPVT
jgi:hypothetical protein